jgi:hypothetical protein
MKKMRRALASLLLSLFTFPVMVPIVRASTAPSLHACCRLSGAHHCAMASAASTEESPSGSVRPKCPYYGSAVAIPFGSNAAAGENFHAIHASMANDPAAPALTVARHRAAFSRTRQTRGPPPIS